MPRISKIRIVGVRYENFKKCHENTIFDLTKEGDADHTLLTLNNGSGKGVIMQLMSQIGLPNTRWGRNDGNKITGMFLDRNNQFAPYSFHVIIEWQLDTVPEKWLITGMCVTGVKTNANKEENEEDKENKEEKISVKYFLYTHEHYANSFYNIGMIPAYNEKEKRAVSYDEFEKFIVENKRDFRKFSQSSTKDIRSEYYQYLEGHGIYRSEWKILKLINKVEGGVADYFSKAKDNKGIFDEYIIPIISENLNNQFEENKNALKDIFKSNISITKNLPILISREADYKNLLSLLTPLIQDADTGISYENRKLNYIAEGNDLYCTLTNFQSNMAIETDKWEKEEAKAKNEEKELSFQKDNLDYVRIYQQKEQLQAQKAAEEEKLAGLKLELESLKEEKKKYQINKIIIPMEQEVKKRDIKTQEKNKLIGSLDLKDMEAAIKELDDKIKIKWDDTRSLWRDTLMQHKAYELFLKGQEEKIKKELEDIKTKINECDIKIQVFENEQKEFNQKEKELGGTFDPFRIAFPEMILSDIQSETGSKGQALQAINKEVEKLEAAILDQGLKKNKLELARDGAINTKEKLDAQYKKQKEEEEALFINIIETCKLEMAEATYSHSWLQNRIFEMSRDKTIKNQRLNELKKALWENNIDLALNTKTFWIPNHDIEIVKEQIEKLGIKVIYGTQYLKELDKKRQNEEIHNFPLLPYGLIIASLQEWETINSSLSEDFLLRSMVPLYIRTEMKEASALNYKLPKHQGLAFLMDEEKFMLWREQLAGYEAELNENIEALETAIAKTDNLINTSEAMLKAEGSVVLSQRIRELELDISKYLEELSATGSKIDNCEERLQFSKKKKQEIQVQIQNLDKQIAEVQAFIVFKNTIEEKKKEAKKEEDKRDIFNGMLREKQQVKENIEKKKTLEHTHYITWKITIDHKLKQIKEVISEAQFKEETYEAQESSREPHYSSIEEDTIYSELEYRKSLTSKIEEKNLQIRMLSQAIEDLTDSITKKIKDLKKLDTDWDKYRIKGISLETAELESDIIEKGLQNKQELYNDANSKISAHAALIEQIEQTMKQQAARIDEEHHKTPQIWDGINLGKKEVQLKEAIKSNVKYIKDVTEILKGLEKEGYALDNLLNDLVRYEEIDASKGTTSEYLMEKIKGNEKNEVEQWKQGYKKITETIKKHTDEAGAHFEQFLEGLKINVKDEILKHKISELIGGKINAASFSSNRASFNSMKEHAEREIGQVNNDKLKAEEAREQWAARASRQAIKISACLKEMVSKMVYVNDNNYAFKLVRLKGEDILPKEEADIKPLLNEYFISCIEKLEKAGADFDNLDDHLLDTYMSDKIIFSKAVRAKYPTLEVYKMTDKNEFLYAKPQNHHYATWAAVNSGEGDAPEGSGGQNVSINTFMIMMLMNYRKKTIGNDNPWTVLMMDNPFGKASGAHVLDPIFKIANKLNFQIIAFAAPEIIKTEISERFPVFWALKINNEEVNGKLGSVIGKVVHGGRIVS
jgi:hypothetical protein